MRNWMVCLIAILFLVSFVAAAAPHGFMDPAPHAGDGIPDGSGFDSTDAPNGVGDAFGPAPQSGDGIPDGSGLEPPHGAAA